jgi:peptidoglycan/LPS O-acetylase OafA/YrhL
MILSSRFFNFENKTLKVFVNYTALAALLFFFTVLFGISWSNKHVFYWVAFFVQVFTAFLILHVFMLNGSLVKRILRKKPLVWIGSISYGLYLWHDPIFELIRMQGYSKWIIAIFGITITFLVSSLSFYLVEKPILRFKSKFTPNLLIQKKSIMNISENKKVPSEEETYSC